jgi:hypothetical protein
METGVFQFPVKDDMRGSKVAIKRGSRYKQQVVKPSS